jgi:DNA-directed RNA polymerase subunit RPC12/RpoP
MDAVRCLNCGETRWTLFSGSLARLLGEPCQSCGGRMVLERRRPGTSGPAPVVERRDRAGVAR